ncbi:MAG: 4'-phosphopantetheinyl transferase [Hyphomicrobiales bacterium]
METKLATYRPLLDGDDRDGQSVEGGVTVPDPERGGGALALAGDQAKRVEPQAGEVISTGIVRGLLPSFAEVAEGAIDAIEGVISPEEKARIATAVSNRRKEFAAGRTLAHRLLQAMGAASAPLLAGEDRVPRWPAGFTGSISHSARDVAVAVARSSHVAALGIDLEDVERFRFELEPYILSPDEIARHLARLDPGARQASTAAMFCAKEAYYKAQYPLAGRRLGFHDVGVELDEAKGAFEVWRITEPGRRVVGRFSVVGGLAAAAVWFPPEVRSAPDLRQTSRSRLMSASSSAW